MAGASSTAPSLAGSLQVLLAATFAAAIALLTLTEMAVLPTRSPDGRLVLVEPGVDSLTTNESRLALPAGSSWQKIRLQYEVKDGEALSFVVQRSGDALLLFRLSRLTGLADGFLSYRRGVLDHLDRIDPVPMTGSLEIARKADRIEVARDGVVLASTTAGEGAGQSFEVVMLPPHATVLHDRVRLQTVTLQDGRVLGTRWLPLIARSPLFVVALVAALFGIFRRSAARRLEKLFPYMSAHRPWDLVWFFGAAAALPVAIVAITSVDRIPTAQRAQRILFVLLVLIYAAATLWLGRMRDRLLTKRPRLGDRRVMHPSLQFPILLVFTALWFFGLSRAFFFGMIMRPRFKIEPPARGDDPRVAFYGGSVTRGYPFSEDEPFPTFAALCQDKLRAAGHPHARTFNLGVDAADTTYILQHLAPQLALLHPETIVISPIHNNQGLGLDEYRTSLERIIEEAHKSGVTRIVIVREVDLSQIYQGNQAAGGLYSVLDELGAAGKAIVVDPLPEFMRHHDEFLLMTTKNLTARGHELLAEIIARYL